jgi:pimeloyl-ACP methyl ester carboxylesterase
VCPGPLHLDELVGIVANVTHRLSPPPTENTVADLAAYASRTLEDLFPEPARVPVVLVKRRWRALGVESDLAWFPSQHQPLEPRFARRYRSYRANHTVWTRWVRPAAASGRPRLLYLHGFMQPETPIEEVGLLTRLATQLRVEVVQVQPPYHGRRRPRGSRLDGELFFTADVVRSIEALRQSILDARSVLSWMLDTDDRPVGVVGLSLGGALAAALTCLEPRFAFSVPLIAHMDVAATFADAPVLEGVRRELREFDFAPADLARFFDGFGWSELRPRLPLSRILLLAASDDHFFRPAIVEVMWRRWGEPPIHWYPCSHMGFLPHLPDAIARVGELVDAVHRETRRALPAGSDR